jgi:hypothetical protein
MTLSWGTISPTDTNRTVAGAKSTIRTNEYINEPDVVSEPKNFTAYVHGTMKDHRRGATIQSEIDRLAKNTVAYIIYANNNNYTVTVVPSYTEFACQSQARILKRFHCCRG